MEKRRIAHLIIGLLLPALAATQLTYADTAAELKQAEGLCRAGQYVQAEQIYQAILQREPNNAESVYQAGRMLPSIYLATDQLPKAQEVVLQLLAKSAGHPRPPHANSSGQPMNYQAGVQRMPCQRSSGRPNSGTPLKEVRNLSCSAGRRLNC
jgi:tetratricopeptide (TPR) repeat protein